MKIEYKNIKEFSEEELQNLFLSVEWLSGRYPEKLKVAMRNSDTVLSAWHEGQLVGLINALDDGILTAYIHYLLVHPSFQKQGVGKELVLRIREIYKDYLRIVLICDKKEIPFYQNCGFEVGENTTPMFINTKMFINSD